MRGLDLMSGPFGPMSIKGRPMNRPGSKRSWNLGRKGTQAFRKNDLYKEHRFTPGSFAHCIQAEKRGEKQDNEWKKGWYHQ